jgi:enamine deaminase RidA (YjgF/YER057c/UK114 family)
MFHTISVWVPRNHLLQGIDNSGAATHARFTLADDQQVYLDQARKWLSRDGSAFGNYLGVSLSEYLADGAVEVSLLNQRRDTFREQMGSVLGAASPLIQINANVLAAIHPEQSATGAVSIFSTVPFAGSTSMEKIFTDVLTNAHIVGAELDRVLESLGQSSTQVIDVFSFQSNPLQPMVYDSIMKPIADAWASVSGDKKTRSDFWKWSRARNLREFIPADPTVIHAMIRGWFITTALGYFRAEKNEMLGPKIEVWSPHRQWQSFPHPLLYRGIAPDNEYLGAVMESLAIAMVQCNTNVADPLGPLAPYKRLMQLGDMDGQLTGELEQWVHFGTQPPGAPVPRTERAGSATGTPEERREALVAFYNQQLATHEKLFADYIAAGNPYHVQRNWEIAPYITSDLLLLREALKNYSLEEFN